MDGGARIAARVTERRRDMTEPDTIWPAWASGPLLLVLADAEEEARERGDSEVQLKHLALAMLRQPSSLWDLLRSLGVEPRRWRDYINQIIGVNIGERANELRDADFGFASGPAALRYAGPLRLSPRTSACLKTAHALAGDSAGAEHVLLSFMGTGEVAGGTARWMGLTERRLREALSLPIEIRHYRRGPGDGPRPIGVGPLVLMGSCQPNPTVLTAALSVARPAIQPVVATIFAADGLPDHGVIGAFSNLGARVVDPGIYAREHAHDLNAAAQLRHADVVFIGGGFAKVLCDALLGTPVLEELVAASDSGAVIIGCSAGVSLMSVGVSESWSAPGDPPGPFPMLDWLRGVAIEPHLSPGLGMERLREALRTYPGSRGLGVAHLGAVLVDSGWRRARTVEAGFEPGNVLLQSADATVQPIGPDWVSIA